MSQREPFYVSKADADKRGVKNGDLVRIRGSKKNSPSLQWLTFAATGKARAAIRRYWQSKKDTSLHSAKKYIWVEKVDTRQTYF